MTTALALLLSTLSINLWAEVGPDSAITTRVASVIPQNVNQSLRSGYTRNELGLVDADLEYIRKLVFRGKSPATNRKPIYLATAGAPGARKSTILENYLSTKEKFRQAVYIDPDQRALKFMGNSYYGESLTNLEIAKAKDYQSAQRKAYEHWRAASNFIANTLLNEAVAGKYDIAHGTTLSGPHSGALLQNLRNAGYEVILILCGAEDDTRMAAVRHRNEVQGFYQTDPADVKDKALLFSKRLPDYFAHASRIWIHWSDNISSTLDPAAYVTVASKEFVITDIDLYRRFVEKLDRDAVTQLGTMGWSEFLAQLWPN